MISTFTAFIDANVFYGVRLRSLILFVAQAKLFRARWSSQVHDEWTKAVVQKRKHPSISIESLKATRDAMDAAIPDCLVTGYEGLEAGLMLPDPKDVHVLAAAIHVHASVIVTFNLKDFPQDALDSFGIHAKHPDDFLCDALSIDAALFLQCVANDFRHYRNPPLEFQHYCDDLRNAGVPKLAEALRGYEVLVTS
jgi:predicted nucleic acid-binding protein